MPLISSDIVYLIIRGDNNLKGLISICGKGGSEHISCSFGLGLLDRLLDVTHNPMAEAFM